VKYFVHILQKKYLPFKIICKHISFIPVKALNTWHSIHKWQEIVQVVLINVKMNMFISATQITLHVFNLDELSISQIRKTKSVHNPVHEF